MTMICTVLACWYLSNLSLLFGCPSQILLSFCFGKRTKTISAGNCPRALEKYRKSRQSSASSCLLGKHSALLRRADAFAGFAGIFQFTAPPSPCLRGPARQLKDDFVSGTTVLCTKTIFNARDLRAPKGVSSTPFQSEAILWLNFLRV